MTQHHIQSLDVAYTLALSIKLRWFLHCRILMVHKQIGQYCKANCKGRYPDDFQVLITFDSADCTLPIPTDNYPIHRDEVLEKAEVEKDSPFSIDEGANVAKSMIYDYFRSRNRKRNISLTSNRCNY